METQLSTSTHQEKTLHFKSSGGGARPPEPQPKLSDGYRKGALSGMNSLARLPPLGPRFPLPKLSRRFVSNTFNRTP